MKTLKTIKTLALLASVCVAVLFATGCDNDKDVDGGNGGVKPEEELLPIDWENYNDVNTVWYNFHSNDCSTVTRRPGKTIKIAGWLMQPGGNLHEIGPEFLYLTNRPNQIFFSADPTVTVQVSIECIDPLKIKFTNSDLTKKCYITGELTIEDLSINNGCMAIPLIWITDVDDIYFE